jgi:hypothetical protein
VQKVSRKHGQDMIAADALLRSMCSNGTRIQVRYQELAEKLGITPSVASTVLLGLFQMEGSGLRRIKGGMYEYKTPDGYPRELEELKLFLNTNQPRVLRPNLTAEIIEHLREKYNPGDLVTIHTMSEELEARDGSVANVLQKLVEIGTLELTGYRGTYQVPRQPTLIVDNLSGMQAEIMKQVEEAGGQVGPGGQSLPVGTPTPATVAPHVAPVMEKATTAGIWYKSIGTNKDSKTIVQGPGGKLYTLEEL